MKLLSVTSGLFHLQDLRVDTHTALTTTLSCAGVRRQVARIHVDWMSDVRESLQRTHVG